MPEMVSAAVPVSVTVMDWAVLVDPTNWPEKVSDVEESEIAGEVAGGVVLLEPPPRASFTFPVLSGIREDTTEDSRRERVLALLRLEEDMGYLARDVSEVDASDPEDMRVVVQVDHQAVSLLLGDTNYGRRYQNFLGHFQEIEQRSPRARTFDLRLEDRITAKE